MASLVIAYLLWAFGGLLGLHHLYLGRVNHAFAWFCTGGGGFIGWLWDLCALPFYVHECNNPRTHHDSLRRLPPFTSTARFVGQLVLGGWLALAAGIAVPPPTREFFAAPLPSLMYASAVALGASAGVHIVGNIGLQRRPLLSAWLGAWPSSFLVIGVIGYHGAIALVAAAAALSANRAVEWRQRPAALGARHFLCWAILYLSVWAWGLGWNSSIHINGRRLPLFEAVKEAFEQENPDGFHWSSANAGSWFYTFENLKQRVFVPPGEVRAAFKMLDLTEESTQTEIKTRCRQMLKETHPDRQGVTSDKKFINVKNACDVLGYRSGSHHKKPNSQWRADDEF